MISENKLLIKDLIIKMFTDSFDGFGKYCIG